MLQDFEENVMECHEEPATGVLLSNLGTPAAPTAGALRRFLREFLWDPRVVEWPRPLWWLLLGGVSASRLLGSAADSPLTRQTLGWGMSGALAWRF